MCLNQRLNRNNCFFIQRRLQDLNISLAQYPVKTEKLVMDLSERRVVGSLLLLSGLTFFTLGLHTEQLEFVLDIVKKIFETAVLGVP